MSISTILRSFSLLFFGLIACVFLAGLVGCGDDDTSEGDVDAGPDVVFDTDADVGPVPDEVPGTIEERGRPEMNSLIPAHEAADPTDEEIVIYYYREDANYEPWAVWLWAHPGGDGANHWDFTQDFEVVEGAAFLKFRRDGADVGGISPLGPDNEFGFIIRQDDDWIKDGDEDRYWDGDTSNEVVVFSGDQTTYPYGPYIPYFEEARMLTTTTLDVSLSGRHALETTPSDNGFVVRHADDSRTYPIADVQNFDNPDDRTDNYIDRLLVTLSEEAELGPALVIEHPQYLEPFPINNTDLLVQAAEQTIPAPDVQLGAVYSPDEGEVEFRVWSPLSTAVVARLYGSTGADEPAYEIPLTLDTDSGLWTGTFREVDPEGMFYDYLVTNRNGTNACLDPYTISMDAYRNTSDAGRGAIIDLAGESAVPDGWADDDYYPLEQREDAIIYEIHVRDFTISPDAEVSSEPGTYQAFIEKLPYLQDLGVTHVQLLPVLNFYYTDETDHSYEDSGTSTGNNYNWGYDPHNYFTPEGWYATDPTDPYSRVRELRELIMAIHDHGMGVLLDVVYNHVAAPFLFDNLVPGYYFRTNPNGSLTSRSGCGNDVASTHTMVRRLIVDSTRFWVENYHVDGFRFDLMGLTDAETMEAAHEACAEVNARVLFEGEGWKMYNGPAGTLGTDQNYMTHTDDISVFNDEIRDLLKAGGLHDLAQAFLTNLETDTEDIFLNLIGQPQRNYTADDPGDSLVYLAAHDNLTLHDNISVNATLYDDEPSQRQSMIDRIEIGNFLVLTSQGIAFLHGGQERARSKPRLEGESYVIGRYISNSYDSSDNINQFVWTVDEPAQELIDFTRGLIQLRRAMSAFRIGNQADIESATEFIEHENGLSLGYRVSYQGETYFILANADRSVVTFDLGWDVSEAEVLVDDDEANVDGVVEVTGITIESDQVTLEGLTQALLKITD